MHYRRLINVHEIGKNGPRKMAKYKNDHRKINERKLVQ